MPDGRRRAQHHRIVTAPPTAQVDDLIDNAVAAKLATARRAGVVCFVDYKGDKYFFKQHGITTENRNSSHGACTDTAKLHTWGGHV